MNYSIWNVFIIEKRHLKYLVNRHKDEDASSQLIYGMPREFFMNMNLVIITDIEEDIFTVVKNRWPREDDNIKPLAELDGWLRNLLDDVRKTYAVGNDKEVLSGDKERKESV